MTVRIYHDFTCPWCWIALFQAQRLQSEYGVKIEWIGAELWPETLEWPEPSIRVPEPANKPPLKSRLDFLKYIEGIDVPKVERPKRMRIHRALLAAEIAKRWGVGNVLVEALYRAYWERGEPIGALEVILKVCEGIVPSVEDLGQAIEAEEGADKLVYFDKPAYAAGIYNVPTFEIGGERLAEQPYGELAVAIETAKTLA